MIIIIIIFKTIWKIINKKWYIKNHKEINAKSFCQKCEVYMCNKYENFLPKLSQNHISINLNTYNNDIFIAFVKKKSILIL